MINFKEIINLSNRTFLISAICAIEKQYYVHILIWYNNHVCVFDFNDISFSSSIQYRNYGRFIHKENKLARPGQCFVFYLYCSIDNLLMVPLYFDSADDIFVIPYYIKRCPKDPFSSSISWKTVNTQLNDANSALGK